ncbi:MAG: DUF4199 domain-containing protein [Cytophagales bacterium]|nr:MAG: DUF4199 domain-containing protein [Cytophagales bacterium]
MQQETTPKQIGTKYGLMIGVGSIILHLILFVTHIYADNPSIAYLDNLIMLIGLILACRAFKANFYDTLTYKQGIMVGFWAMLVSSLLTASFIFLYIELDKELLEALRTEEMLDLAKQKLPDEQFNELMKRMDTLMSPWFIALTRLVRGLGIGLILAAAVATFMKKEPKRM